MFIRAVIQLADGTEKIIEANGKTAPLKFCLKIAPYARKENKLKQVVCDNPQWIEKFQKELPHVKVCYGFKEGEQVCVLE